MQAGQYDVYQNGALVVYEHGSMMNNDAWQVKHDGSSTVNTNTIPSTICCPCTGLTNAIQLPREFDKDSAGDCDFSPGCGPLEYKFRIRCTARAIPWSRDGKVVLGKPTRAEEG